MAGDGFCLWWHVLMCEVIFDMWGVLWGEAEVYGKVKGEVSWQV